MPIFLRGLVITRVIERTCGICPRKFWEILYVECKMIFGGGKLEMVTVAFLEGGIACPAESDVVFCRIERAFNDGRVVVLGDDL